MGNAFNTPLAPLTDSKGLTYKNFNDAKNQHNAGLSETDEAAGSQMFQTSLILPEPCTFLSDDLPPCSIIRPTLSQNGGPTATIMAFTADGLFHNQNPMFLEALMDLASDAEAAQRGM
jgi:hypothetical protein